MFKRKKTHTESESDYTIYDLVIRINIMQSKIEDLELKLKQLSREIELTEAYQYITLTEKDETKFDVKEGSDNVPEWADPKFLQPSVMYYSPVKVGSITCAGCERQIKESVYLTYTYRHIGFYCEKCWPKVKEKVQF